MIFSINFLLKYVLHSKHLRRAWFLSSTIIATQVLLLAALSLPYWLDLFVDLPGNRNCLPRTCDTVLNEAYVQMCANYRQGIFVGDLCPAICDEQEVQLVACPSLTEHTGKDCVVQARSSLTNQSLIIKAQVYTLEELLGKSMTEFEQTQAQYLHEAIPALLADRIDHSLRLELIFELMSPWPWREMEIEEELNNLWFLLQDNEYVLSKSRESSRIFPRILSTCGHFYAVEFVENVVDYSYFVPHVFTFQLRSSREKIQLALDFLAFLKRFSTSLPKLELCDVKYSHFGYLTDQNEGSSHQQFLALLDSDMIYPFETINRSISSIANCHSDHDCHFIDCQGKCIESKCFISRTDSDLKRVCRNIFFMGKLYGLVEFGLLNLENKYAEASHNIYKLCFEIDGQQDAFLLEQMESILLQMLRI